MNLAVAFIKVERFAVEGGVTDLVTEPARGCALEEAVGDLSIGTDDLAIPAIE